MTAAVEIQNVSRKYGNITALKDVSLTINSGERFGLIGPDGAGKTTLIRILCGLLSPDSGRFSILGLDGRREIKTIKQHIGYMPQKFSLYPDLTVRENLQFFADLFGVRGSARREREERLLKFSRLGPFARRRAHALSGGMKQKLALSCALIHTPDILILDEPTTGVDPLSRREFWNIITDLSEHENTTVLVSTPYMDEAVRCHRVAFLNAGQILALDTPDKLPEILPFKILEISGETLKAQDVVLPDLPEIHSSRPLGDRVRLSVTNPESIRSILETHLDNQGIKNVELTLSSPTLEDVFVYFLESSHEPDQP